MQDLKDFFITIWSYFKLSACIKAVLNLYKEAIRKWARTRAASQGKFCSSEGTTSFIHVRKQCNLPEKWALCLWGSQQSGLTDLFNLMPGLWTESTQNKQDQFPASPAPSPRAQHSPPLAHRYCFLWLAAKSMTTPARDLFLRHGGGKKVARQVKLSGGKKEIYCDMW